jgi:hypothetical protein
MAAWMHRASGISTNPGSRKRSSRPWPAAGCVRYSIARAFRRPWTDSRKRWTRGGMSIGDTGAERVPRRGAGLETPASPRWRPHRGVRGRRLSAPMGLYPRLARLQDRDLPRRGRSVAPERGAGRRSDARRDRQGRGREVSCRRGAAAAREARERATGALVPGGGRCPVYVSPLYARVRGVSGLTRYGWAVM